ncbi:MAG: hypothetical protein AAB954_01140 [Patescibacteria group bacterium]
MISIPGIENQKELQSLPYFTKNAASVLIGKTGRNLDKKIAQLTKIGYLETFKKGFYVSSAYAEKMPNEPYSEFIANVLRSPSYLSCEYVLAKEGLIAESVFAVTSITTKTSRSFSNFLGTFMYKNIKSGLFTGYYESYWEEKIIYIATKAKALFDYFYLKKMENIEQEIYDSRINWNNFSREDLHKFEKYVTLASGKKMFNVLKWIKRNYVN